MKKLIYLLPVLALFFTACDPMDDIYTAIDAQDNGIVGNAEYTLTDDDYEILGRGYGTFDNEDQVIASDIPNILSEVFPVWGKNSSVLVNYQLYLGTADGVNDYKYADSYDLSVADYASSGSDALGFYPDVAPEDFLADILAANISGQEEGDIVLVKYDQYIENPTVGYTDIPEYSYDFNGDVGSTDFDGFEAIDVLNDGADAVWNKGKSSYIRITGFSYDTYTNTPNEDWLISPEIDLTEKTNLRFQMRQYLKYVSSHPELINILVSTDYTTGGDHTAATWTTLEIAGMPPGDDSNYYNTDYYNLIAYEGETIHIAFKYESTVEAASTWRIDWAKIKEIGITGEANSSEDFYVYTSGAWVPSEAGYFVQDLDFATMGTAEGQPGEENTFGSSIPQDDYLPTFLALKFPFAQEGEEFIVIYDYDSSKDGPGVRGNLYTVIDGVWVAYESKISASFKYGHNGVAWEPDNTIRYTLVTADYSFIATEFTGVDGFVLAAENLTKYGNFSRYDGDTKWSDDMLVTAMGALADNIDPTASVAQQYVFIFSAYGPSRTEELSIIKTNDGWVLND